MALDTSSPRSRRHILAAAGAAVAAVLGNALGRAAPVSADQGGNVILGANSGPTNQATTETKVENITLVGASLHGYHATSGTGLAATSQWGIGLRAESSTHIAVQAMNTAQSPSTFTEPSHQTAVLATAGAGSGVAANTDETAVYGFCNASPNSTGVWGDSVNGTGLVGTGGGTGLYASGGIAGVVADCNPGAAAIYGWIGDTPAPPPVTGVAVLARTDSTAWTALSVIGKVRFSRSGRTYVSAGHSSRGVYIVGVTAASYVIATPQTNRAGVFVQAVVPSAGKISIYLNKVVSGTTYIGYLVIN